MVTFTFRLWMSVFLSFKFNCGGKKEKLSKAGSDRIKSVIDSSKVYNDGKHVELQQILQ